jgi:hypothetical protein
MTSQHSGPETLTPAGKFPGQFALAEAEVSR